VRQALAQNLGIQVARIDPQIQDLATLETRTAWTPTLTSSFAGGTTDTPVTNAFAGGQDRVTDSRLDASFGISQRLRSGADYRVGWESGRFTSSNFFNSFDPQIRSSLSFNVSQPLVRNFKIDDVRRQLETDGVLREEAEIDLLSTVARTVRAVKTAYWDLSFAIANLSAQRQSLDLAERLLADNERRVQVGTMAPLDIVEAQSEVARNQESVIVAGAAVGQAEDRLRALIFDPSMPDFWSVTIEPMDSTVLDPPADMDAAVRHAMDSRTDILLSRNRIGRDDISVRYLQNQALPDVSAQVSYGAVGVGGSQLAPLTSFPIGDSVIPMRDVAAERGFGSVLGDVVTNAYPTWSVGVQVGYPLGRSAAQASLARVRLEHAQALTALRQLELQVATEVRDAIRQVQTNGQRIASARAARELAERRLEAEEKKFAAGIQISFFVLQAQRDLAQARTNEVRATADYNKSVVDLEAIQETPIP
jgi:outer membrane protein TolC